ncbi:cytochrome bd-I oxidase subunit CydX [Endothiovibrio diazotrophicus]
MWYFTWILGVLLALSLGVINAMWLEAEEARVPAEEDSAGKDGR